MLSVFLFYEGDKVNYLESVEYINSFLKFGSKPGLERITALLELLENPQEKLKFIHVAGTNGKGSICTYLSNICVKAGLRTGLFISPYITDFKERFQVDNEMILEDEFARITSKVKSVVDTLPLDELPTEFEMITAIAFLFFLERKCEIVVLEVGLGGKFDSTNVIKNTICSVITSISLDHENVLGSTIKEIAYQKCGIIKEGSKTVCYPLQDEDALKVIKEQSSKMQNSLVIASVPKVLKSKDSYNLVEYNKLKFKLYLQGFHQVLNVATAIEAIKAADLGINDSQIVEGIESSKIAARCEIISKNPLIVLDGGHNLDGILALKNFLNEKVGNCVGIIGMMKDKDASACLESLAPCFSKIYTVTVNNERSFKAKELAVLAKKYHQDVESADFSVFEKLYFNNHPFCVCGSLYLASEVRPILEKLNK